MSFVVVWFCDYCTRDNLQNNELVGCMFSGFPSVPRFHLLKISHKNYPPQIDTGLNDMMVLPTLHSS